MAKGYSVFEITNTKNGRKHFMVSSTYTEENILSGIRTYVNSKSVGGGAKELAQDIKGAGKEMQDRAKEINAERVKERDSQRNEKILEKEQKVQEREQRQAGKNGSGGQ